MSQNFIPLSSPLFKWCNCYRPLSSSPIIADCYNTSLEALDKLEDFAKWGKNNIKYQTKLIPVFRYMPEFIQAKVIKHHFNPSVEFGKPENA